MTDKREFLAKSEVVSEQDRLEAGLDQTLELRLIEAASGDFCSRMQDNPDREIKDVAYDTIYNYRSWLQRKWEDRRKVLSAGYRVVVDAATVCPGLIVLSDHGDLLAPDFQFDPAGQTRQAIIDFNLRFLMPPDSDYVVKLRAVFPYLDEWDLALWWLEPRDAQSPGRYHGRPADASTASDFEQLAQDVVDPIYPF